MTASEQRLVSLDAFRGLTIGAMVLVNNPGSFEHVHAPLEHAEWHGWTPTDLVFPFFLFIVGVSMTFALPRQLEALGKPALYRRVLRRCVLLFALGLLLNLSPEFALGDLRIAGVLQRIAIVYLAVSVLYLETSRRTQIAVALALLGGYWLLMTRAAAPGFEAGDLSPEGNLASWIDRRFLPGRLWRETWDPEGLLSTLPSIATALTGVFTGYWLRSGADSRRLISRMLAWGGALMALGLVWDVSFPINKNLWTSSYVLFTTGAALLLLAGCYWLIEIEGRRRWAQPLLVFGRNPIALYVLSSLVARATYKLQLPGQPEGTTANTWIFERLFLPWAPSPEAASLVYAILYLLIWWVLISALDKRGIHLKV